MDNMGREAVLYELSNRMYEICERRSVSCIIERKVKTNILSCIQSVARTNTVVFLLLFLTIGWQLFQHDANAVICDSELTSELKFAANAALKRITGEIQDEVPVLMSGAGHDAMAMSHLTKASSFQLH